MWRKFWDMNFSERNYKLYLNRAQVSRIRNNDVDKRDLALTKEYLMKYYLMWEHWCPVEHTTMNVGNGEECNWCGQNEEYESCNRRYRNRLTTTNTDPLHSSKGSTNRRSISMGL